MIRFLFRTMRSYMLQSRLLIGGAVLLTVSPFFLWFFHTHASSPITTFQVEPRIIRQIDGIVLLDIGQTWFGNISLKPTPENYGNKVIVRLGERLNHSGRVDLTPMGSVRSYELETTLGDATFVPELRQADTRGLPQGDAAMQFRYIEIDGWKGEFPIQVLTTKIYISSYYRERGRIEFLGADRRVTELNRLVKLGVHTMASTSFMGLFVDGDRERLPYQADAYINQMSWYAVTGDTEVARHTFQQLLLAPTWPSEWMIHFIFLAYEDYMTTGDIAYLRKIYDRLAVFTLLDFVDDSGLVSTTNKLLAKQFVDKTKADYLEDIVDWPPQERDGYEMTDHNTVVNAFVYQGLRKMATMATALQRSSEAKNYTAAADRLGAAMELLLVDPTRDVFVDGLESNHASAHALFIPLAFGLVPEARISATLDALKDRIAAFDGGFPCSVYAAQYLLDALFENGEGATAVNLITNRTDRGWLNMLNTYDATITHEAWDIKYKENEDWNHAWGSAFLNVMQRHIAGVRILKSGWSSWTVAPYINLGIPMRVIVPTPGGDVSIVIDPAAKEITVTGAAPLENFVKSVPSDQNWTYKLIKNQ